jgi:signal transduction histidine kinase
MTYPRVLPSLSILATVAIAIASVGAIQFFRRAADDSSELSVEMVTLQNLLAQIDGVEGQSAYHQIVTAKNFQMIAQLEGQMDLTLARLQQHEYHHHSIAYGANIQIIKNLYQTYRSNLHKSLQLLTAEEFEQSGKVSTEQVETTFNALRSLLADSSDQAIDSARQANYLSDWGASGTIVVGAIVIGVIIRRVERSNLAAQKAQSEQQLLQAKAATLQEERALLEQRVADRTYDLDDRNQALTTALAQLQMAQVELIQSEKMAALGQLIAGIAHEINTPMGAIQASTGNSNKALLAVASDLPKIDTLPLELRPLLSQLLHQGLITTSTLSSLEKRPLRNHLTQSIKSVGLSLHPNQVDRLIDMGIRPDNLDLWVPLLQSEHRDLALQFTYNFNRLQHNNKTVQTAVERASKIVFALKSYAHQDSAQQSQQSQEPVAALMLIETIKLSLRLSVMLMN